MLEQPLDRFSVGLVAELASELENPSSTQDRHADAPPPAIDLRVAIFRQYPFRRWLLGAVRCGGEDLDGGGGGG